MQVFLSRSIDRTNVLGITFPKIVEIMNVVLSCAKGKTDMVDRKDDQRGYFHVSKIESNNSLHLFRLFTIPFGDIPGDAEEKYFFLSEEKASRLYLNLINRHTTSYESRSVDTKKFPPFGAWGGSVLSVFYINLKQGGDFERKILSKYELSFSGMPELIDEAIMVSVGEIVARLANVKMMETDAHSRNPHWKQIFDEAWITILTQKQKGLF